MDVSVVITREGKVSVFAKSGTFSMAKEKIERLLNDLGLQGIEFEVVGDVECHAHDRPEVHQQTDTRAREGEPR